MNLSTAISTGTAALTAAPGIPAQRTSDAFTAYASVHQLSIALQRDHGDSTALRPTA